jgi:transcriptional regulator NrdR family protein
MPACPTCECEMSSILRRYEAWGRTFERRLCRHCGREFPVPVEEVEEAPPVAVPHHTKRCPSCGSTRVRVTSTQKPVRYQKCGDCQHTFKSIEQT